MQKQFERETFHSHNLYQIFAYVKNADTTSSGAVSGMLLYAKTEESITPDAEFTIGGNHFSVKTLDLNRASESISEQLDAIVAYHFGSIPKKHKNTARNVCKRYFQFSKMIKKSLIVHSYFLRGISFANCFLFQLAAGYLLQLTMWRASGFSM